MIRLVVNDTVLDLDRDAKITIRLTNPAYLGKDVGKISSAFSYPFPLPLTARNRETLGYPDRIDNARRLVSQLPASLSLGPDTVLVGQLYVKSSTRTKPSAYFISNPLGDLAKLNLNESDQGVFEYATTDALVANMRDTMVNPLARPFISFPVYNSALDENPQDIAPGNEAFQNCWDFGAQTFRQDEVITPFLRSEYVLRRAIEGAGYTFTDRFHVTDEHRRLVLVNNRALNKRGGPITLKLPYNAFLPEDSVSDLLKDQCRHFCLAPFSNLSGNHLTLQPLADLARRGVRRDWTKYAGREYNIPDDDFGVSRYAAAESAHAPTRSRSIIWEDKGKPAIIVDDFPVGPEPDTLYYVTSRATYAYYYAQPNGTVLGDFRESFGSVIQERDGEEVVPGLSPLQSTQILFYPSGGDNLILPVWGAEMVPPPSLDTTTGGGAKKVTHALTLYRGLQQTSQGTSYPLASFNNYRVDFTKIPGEELTLRWLGNNGQYANHWKEWDDVIQNGRPLKQEFLLPLAELLSFDFQEKIRSGNQNYFVRSIEFTATQRGINPCVCELLSVS